MDHLQPHLISQFTGLKQHWKRKFKNLGEFAKQKFRVVKDCPHPFAFHLVMWIATTSLIIPYKATINDQGYIRLKVPGLCRRFLSLLLLADLTAHVMVIVAVALKNTVKIMAVGGNFTIDGLIYFTLNVIFTLSVPYVLGSHLAAESMVGIWNAWQKFLTHYTAKFLGQEHIFKLNRYDVKLNLMAAILPCLSLGVGFVAAVLAFIYRESPCLMASYIAKGEVNWMSASMLELIAVAHDAVIFTTVFYGALFIAAMSSKLFFEIMFVLRSLRMGKLEKRSLIRVRHQHAVVEVTIASIHQVAGSSIALIVCHVLSAAVLSTAVVVKLANVPQFPLVFLAPLGIALTFGGIFGLWCIVRLAEDLRSESLDFNLWLERQMSFIQHHEYKDNGRWLRINCQMFRRRAVGIRMSHFYQHETGAAMDYLQTLLDKAISLILMTDSSYPITLMFP